MGVNVVIILTLLPALALLPKARAGCSNSARPDPCGGPPARAVPTATSSRFNVEQLIGGEHEPSKLNVEQVARILFHESLHAFRIRLGVDGGEAFAERAQTATVVGTEDHILFAHLVDQKCQRASIGTGEV